MARRIYKIEDIDDYQNRLTENQAQLLIEHCNKYQIKPEICAWYDNMKDFYSDWCNINDLNFTKEDARSRFVESKETGEFKVFASGEIVRLVY